MNYLKESSKEVKLLLLKEVNEYSMLLFCIPSVVGLVLFNSVPRTRILKIDK